MRKLAACALPLALASLLAIGIAATRSPAFAQGSKKDYLSDNEADQIRDADTPNDRIKLFISFAADRIKKLQYEFAHPAELHRDDRINTLINAYAGCIDDASDSIQLGVEKQQDVRGAIKDMQSHAPEFLTYLKSHGIPEDEAGKLIVNGFIEPITKELPMEYAVEMNRLIELQMEGSIG